MGRFNSLHLNVFLLGCRGLLLAHFSANISLNVINHQLVRVKIKSGCQSSLNMAQILFASHVCGLFQPLSAPDEVEAFA